MSRPFRVVSVAILLVSIFAIASCKTPYSDMYSPRRNNFTPVKDQPKATDVLPPPVLSGGGSNLDAPPPAGLPGLPPPPEPPMGSPPLDPVGTDMAIPGL